MVLIEPEIEEKNMSVVINDTKHLVFMKILAFTSNRYFK